jgi:hypothetical protein
MATKKVNAAETHHGVRQASLRPIWVIALPFWFRLNAGGREVGVACVVNGCVAML